MVPPREAATTRIAASSGPSTTVDHSSALKSAFFVMRRAYPATDAGNGAPSKWKADGRTRTGDILFTREVLYQLSYVGAEGRV